MILGSTVWLIASESIPGRKSPLAFAPHRKLASRRVDEMEAPSAREAEDRLGDGAVRFCHGLECHFEVVNTDHRQRCGERFGGLAVEPDIDVARRGGGIIGAIVGESPTE